MGAEDILNKLEIIDRTCRRITEITRKLQNIQEAATTDYIDGVKMIDLKSDSEFFDD